MKDGIIELGSEFANETCIHATSVNIIKQRGNAISECEKVDEETPQAQQRIKYSVRYSTLARSWRLKHGWHRFKLVEVLTDSELIERIVHGEEGCDWKWVER